MTLRSGADVEGGTAMVNRTDTAVEAGHYAAFPQFSAGGFLSGADFYDAMPSGVAVDNAY